MCVSVYMCACNKKVRCMDNTSKTHDIQLRITYYITLIVLHMCTCTGGTVCGYPGYTGI